MRFFILIFFFYSYFGFAQYTDFQYRFSPSVDYKLNKHWKIGLDYRSSFDHNASTFKSSLFQLQTRYKLNKAFKMEAGFRYRTSYSKDTYFFYGIGTYTWEINNKFELNASTRYQYGTANFDSDFMKNYRTPTHFIRQEVQLKYNIPKSKFDLFISPEFFFKADNTLSLNRIRYNIGTTYKMKYGNTLSCSVFFEDRTKPSSDDRYVLTTSYNMSIDALIKKLKKEKHKREKEEE